jgi:serine/threonine-protein kinase RsbW
MSQEGQPDWVEPRPERSAPPVVGPALDLVDLSAAHASGPVLRTVVLTIPAERGQVVLARSMVGHIAARLGLSVADLTDLRLAVDEACGLFPLSADFGGFDESLECRFEERAAALRITVCAPLSPTVQPELDGIGWIMLGALVDELSWLVVGSIGTVALVKDLNPRAA